MAIGGSRFDDPQYKNWLRATLALMYMKEGLEDFCNDQSNTFHKQLLRGFGKSKHACTSCTSVDIKKDFRNKRWNMAFTNCDAWLQNAISYHRNAPFPNLSAENTAPRKWLTVPWEIIKIYLPYGCEGHTSAKDADVQGILSLFKNCNHFSGCNLIGRADLIDELIEMRNTMYHSGSFQVSDSDVKHYLQIVIDFLQGMNGLTNNQRDSVQESVTKIQELQTNVLDLSLNRELELKSLLQGQKALDMTVGGIAYTVKDLKKEHDTHTQNHDSLETEVHHQKKTMNEFQAQTQGLECSVKYLKKEHVAFIKYQSSTEAEVKRHENAIMKLKIAQDRYNKFLLENDLTQDVARLLKKVHELSLNVDKQDHKICTIEKVMSKSESSIAECSKSKEEQYHDLHELLLGIYANIGWENPVTSEEECNSQMYVKPAVKLTREKTKLGEMTMMKQPQSQPSKVSYHDVFHSTTGLCKNIYVTGDAGTGKTAFCNQLALDWCKAVQNKQDGTDSNDDISVLSAFKFLFYINLRYSEEYHVEDMITEQLLFDYSMPLTLPELLKTENCLIVLDGLDEWTCPHSVKIRPGFSKHIPGRNTSKTCSILTTTRNWKFDIINLSTKEMDKHIELCGIDEDSSSELAQNMVEYLERKCLKKKNISEFLTEVETKNLGSLLTMPAFLIQLITLWHFGRDFGYSKVQLFCNILDFLFERAGKHLPRKTSITSSKFDAKTRKLPDCFSTMDFCQNHTQLLHCLCKLAYEALFSKHKEDALVFKSSTLEIYEISESDINLCLQCGILSQSKHYSNYSGKYKKLSFLHKLVQEFLSAIYIVTTDPTENISKDLVQRLNTVDSVLEMDQTMPFLAGLNNKITTEVLEQLKRLVATDKRVLKYRQSFDNIDLIYSIQNFVIGCIREGSYNRVFYDDVYLQDYIVMADTLCDVECLILWGDTSTIKSVIIDTDYIDDYDQLLSITGQLKQCHALQKLQFTDIESNIPSCIVTGIIQNNCNSLTSLFLSTEITASDTLVAAINMSINTCLNALCIHGMTMTHGNMQQLLDTLINSHTIRDLWFNSLCSEHVAQCRPVIDMSTITQLQTIGLTSLSVENLQAVSPYITGVKLLWLTLPMASLCEFASAISQIGHDVEVELVQVTLTGVYDKHVDLNAFLHSCDGLEVTECEYDNADDTWDIEMKANIKKSQ